MLEFSKFRIKFLKKAFILTISDIYFFAFKQEIDISEANTISMIFLGNFASSIIDGLIQSHFQFSFGHKITVEFKAIQ